MRSRFLGKLNITCELARYTISGPKLALLHFSTFTFVKQWSREQSETEP